MSDALSNPTLTRLMNLIKVAVLVISVAAAVPTARNLYYSYKNDVPFNEVEHRLAQYDLWMKNLDCKINYRALMVGEGTKVDVGACRKTGDIALKISDERGQATYEWIAYDNLAKPASQTASLGGLFIAAAYADDAPVAQSFAPGQKPIVLAQAAMEVVCQAQSGTNIVRVVKDGGKCYREIVSPMKGSVDRRDEVPCDTQCK